MAAKAVFEALAHEAMQQRDYARAEHYLREYLEAAARYVPFLELLGQACEAQGKIAEAAAELAKAVAILLEFPEIEDRVHAERLYEKAKALAPDHPEVGQLAMAFAPSSAPPQETVPPPVEQNDTNAPVAAEAPLSAVPPPTGRSAPEMAPAVETQQAEPPPDPPSQVVEARAPASVSESAAAPPTLDREPGQPNLSAAPTAEPAAPVAPALSAVEPEPIMDWIEVPIGDLQSVHQEASVAAGARERFEIVEAPITSQVQAFSAPVTDGLGSLTPRLTDVAESASRPKPEESVELISLEDWLHEPLSPVPSARVQANSAPPGGERAISLSDQSVQTGLLNEQVGGKKGKAKEESPRDIASLQPLASRGQIEVRSPAPALNPTEESDAAESIRPGAVGQVSGPFANDEGLSTEPLAMDPSSLRLSGEEAGGETAPAEAVATEQTGFVPQPTDAEPPQENTSAVAQDRPRRAAASPITALDPDLKAELETFLKEKTPLTDRAQVFSPFPQSQPSVVHASEEVPSTVQHSLPPQSQATEEAAAREQPEDNPALAPSEPIASAPVVAEESSPPEEVSAGESRPSPTEPNRSVAPTAVEHEPYPTEAEPEPTQPQTAEEVLIQPAETMPEPAIQQEPHDVVEAAAPIIEVPTTWEPEPEVASQDQGEIHDAWQPVKHAPDVIAPAKTAQGDSPAPIEESAWAPREEIREPATADDESCSDELEEPRTEQPSTSDHAHEAHPCALCREARLSEAESGNQEALQRRRSVLSRPLRQVKRWVRAGVSTVTDTTLTATRIVIRLVLVLSTMAVGLPVLALSLVTASWLLMEQKPNANYIELTQAPPRPVEEPTKNGYYLLLGFGAGESVDPLKAGYLKWKTTTTDQSRQCFGLATGARPSVAFSAETRALVLWLQAQDPVLELQRERSLVQRWAAQHRVLMTRYRDWLTMPFEDRGYGSFASPDCAQVLTAHRLYIADGIAHRTSEGLDRLERDLITWRNVLARSKTMATKLLAAQAVKEDIAILAAVAKRGTTEMSALPRFAHLVRPFDQVERSLRWPMQNELLLEVQRIESGLKAKVENEQETGWLTTLLIHLPLPKQRALNAHADYYEALIRAPEQGRHAQTDPYAYTNSPAQDVLDYLINPVDNLLLTPDHLSWQQEASVLFDTDVRLRTLVASRAFQPRPAAPLTAKVQPQSTDINPTLVSEASAL